MRYPIQRHGGGLPRGVEYSNGPRDMRRLRLASVERELEAERRTWFDLERRRLDRIRDEIEIDDEIALEHEEKAAKLARVELRFSRGHAELSGYVVRWLDLSTRICRSGGCFLERVARGAFAASIASRCVVAVAAHDLNRTIGRQSDGSLKLVEDAVGLHATVNLANDTEGRRVAAAVRSGELAEWSFSFNATRETDPSGRAFRTILEAELNEVSPVPRGAYGQPVACYGMETVADLRRQLEAVA